jgi:4-amino-4-deoxy-L-arabinose transferase-like glycosyltransferase
MGKHRHVTHLLLITAAAFGVRVLVSVLFGDNHRMYYEYMTIADHLLKGQGYVFDEWGRAPLQPTSFLPPLYVYWCALFMGWWPSNYLPMYIAQALVAASGCIPAYWVGKKMFSEGVGVAFAVVYAFYPEFAYLHSRPVSEFLYVVLVLWLLVLYLRMRKQGAEAQRMPWLAAAFGALGAVSILVKEATGTFLLAVAIALLLHEKLRLVAWRRIILPMVATGALVMVPWVARNYAVQHELIPVRTGYGLTMWLANHQGATGTDKDYDGRYILETMNRAYLAHVDSLLPADEQDRNLVYRGEVIRFIRTRPGEYLQLCAKRLTYFLWFDPTHPIARSRVYRLSYVFLLALAVPGFMIAYRRRVLDPIVPLAYLGYLVFYVPVIVLPRYRIIPLLMLLLLASYALDVMRSRVFGSKEKLVSHS